MTFKPGNDILKPDPRFATQCVIKDGVAHPLTLSDHHASLAGLTLSPSVPKPVSDAFDRARNAFLYSYFSYELLVVAEVQAFGAFELALKHRLHGDGAARKGTLKNLIDQARKKHLLPALPSAPTPSPFGTVPDVFEVILHMRNALSHGTEQVHPPGMALDALKACQQAINLLYCDIAPKAQ
ncbi:MAG: hypothetical protein ABSF67_12265 [Roseiarcus sp.]|jgi:hypothetical protein